LVEGDTVLQHMQQAHRAQTWGVHGQRNAQYVFHGGCGHGVEQCHLYLARQPQQSVSIAGQQ
jgi:hypothetical protein